MTQRSVAVLGGGVAGLAAALLLARTGCRVTLLERDQVGPSPVDASPGWPRRGIPHFLQPHAFIPRGRLELLTSLPDVYSAVKAAGAAEVDLRRKLPGDSAPGDEMLQYLAVRRPLIEWALRDAVLAQPGITVVDGTRVTGIRVTDGRAAGYLLDSGGECDADLLVDASGRRTPVPGWLAEHGSEPGRSESSPCGVVYYSRYFRCRRDFSLPDGPWPLSPRGDLGYLGYATFPGDNATFATVLAVPPGDPEWRRLRDAAAYARAVAAIPALRAWADPDGVEAITDVLPMAGLTNTAPRPVLDRPTGIAPLGDALSHTDPTLAHGLAFALVHARVLAESLADHLDVRDAELAYRARTDPELRERFDFATALDEQRLRNWTGQHVDPGHHGGDYALFSFAAAGAVALRDPQVFRMFYRRIGLLDRLSVLDDDLPLQHSIERQFATLRRQALPPTPGREEMAALITAPGRDPYRTETRVPVDAHR